MENSVGKNFTAVILLLAVIGCEKKQGAEPKTDFTKITNVEVYTVTTATFEDYLTLPVTVMPNKSVNLGLTAGGRVTKIYVDKGDRVTKGLTLLETDDVLLNVAYEQAQANLSYQKKEFARNERLFKEGSITAAAFDGSELQLATAQSSYNMAKKQYEDATLKATFDGVVTERNIEVGDILGPGSPAFKIIDMNRVKVRGGIPEKYIISFHVGNTVAIRFDAIPEKEFKGKINYISLEASPSVRTFRAEIIVNNDEGSIRAGIMGNAQILRNVYENSIMIPINAIVESQAGRSVFITRDNNTVEEQNVGISSNNDTMALITSGLKAGDRVVVKGQYDLVSGEQINITGEYTPDSMEGSVK